MQAGNLREQLLATARRDFSSFYASATPRDMALIDALVWAHATLVVAINAPRENLPDEIRTELERTTNSNEQFFTDLREEVRVCATFNALGDADQIAIERVLFNVKPPLFGA